MRTWQFDSATGRVSRHWVEQLTALGIVISDRMTAANHVSKLLETCTRQYYVCWANTAWPAHPWTMSSGRQCSPNWCTVLRDDPDSVWLLIAKDSTCSCAGASDCALEALRLCAIWIHDWRWLRYSDGDLSEVAEMFDSTDEALFSRIIRNNKHVLQLEIAISVHFFKSGFSDIFHAKSGYPDFIRIFCAGPYRPLYTV